jgi:hypothetical protein
MSKNGGIAVSDHGGWAVLVTVACDGTLLDRRSVELVDDGLPKLPHHHEAQRLPLDEAVALVEGVRDGIHHVFQSLAIREERQVSNNELGGSVNFS